MISLHSRTTTVLSFVALMTSTGCETLGALSFQRADQSGVSEPQFVELHYVHVFDSDQFKIIQAGPAIDELNDEIDSCKVAGLVPLLAAPFIAAGAQLAFGFVTDSLSSMVARLRDSGQRTYSARSFFEKLPGDTPGCLVLFRYAEPSESSSGITQIDRIGLASIFRKRQVGLGHLWCLDYLWMDNSVAVTAKGDPPNVKVSFAVVEKAVRKAPDFSEIRNLGQGTITVGKAGLTGTGTRFGGDEAKQKYCTDLFGAPLVTSSRVVREWNEDVLRRNGIPIYELRDTAQGQWAVIDLKAGDFWRDYPDDEIIVYQSRKLAMDAVEKAIVQGDVPIGGMIGIGITETGSVAGKFERAGAELKALNAAFGPVIGATIKDLLTPTASP